MVQVVQDLIRPGRKNRPGFFMEPKFLTVHDTGNAKKGADAKAHAKYLHGDSAANIPASWHFTVDDRVIVQHLPLNENGWHAGDGREGPGNRQSIGIEICENADCDRARAEKNAQELIANLLKQFNLPLDAVVPHKRWNGKNCPHLILPRWDEFVSGIAAMLGGTPIIGPPQATVEQAQAWARKRGVHQRFIDIAPIYWRDGILFGIRPEVAYCQAAKETRFGHYGGGVRPEQNNWAGIKTKDAKGDRPEDHESFPTPEDGVRAHYNHMAAYVGLAPIGTPHGRYYVVKALAWAGTVRYIEQLGGKWAPNPDYGRSIVRDYLADLLATEVPVKAGPQPVPFEEHKMALERIEVLEEKLGRVKALLEEATEILS